MDNFNFVGDGFFQKKPKFINFFFLAKLLIIVGKGDSLVERQGSKSPIQLIL
jgi:hypothetical protein